MTKRRLPPQSPECVRDAATVLKEYPDAEAYFERKTAVVHVAGSRNSEMHTLGIGCSAESAWADARRNVTRPPVPELPNRGSATWSLKSDEVFFNNAENAAYAQQPQPVSPVRTSEGGGAGSDFRNEGTPDLSKLEM